MWVEKREGAVYKAVRGALQPQIPRSQRSAEPGAEQSRRREVDLAGGFFPIVCGEAAGPQAGDTGARQAPGRRQQGTKV